jgi:hypothetical protein
MLLSLYMISPSLQRYVLVPLLLLAGSYPILWPASHIDCALGQEEVCSAGPCRLLDFQKNTPFCYRGLYLDIMGCSMLTTHDETLSRVILHLLTLHNTHCTA